MRTLLLVTTLALATFAPLAAAGHVTCATPGVVCIRGTIAGWVAPVTEAAAGATVVFERLDLLPHPAALCTSPLGFLGGPCLSPHAASGDRTVYENVGAGTWYYNCELHANMRGVLKVQ